MRTINITYKDPNQKGAISKIVIKPKSNEDAYKTVTKNIEDLTKRGIYSINIRERQQQRKKKFTAAYKKKEKDENRYLKY